MYKREILDLFNVMVNTATVNSPNLKYAQNGFVLDFNPRLEELEILKDKFSPLPVNTLFTVDERENASIDHLISKQILHYIEVYGLDSPGLFNLEVNGGNIAVLGYVMAISEEELGDKVRDLLYANAPVKDAVVIKNIISAYNIEYDFDKILNNELKVALFDQETNAFTDGDDAVRYICYVATGDLLLIKSPEVISAVAGKCQEFKSVFFTKHEVPLSQVFNRHKRIILAAKSKDNASAVNKISRMSKKTHVPIKESISKNYISKALNDQIDDHTQALDNVSIRDKFKYLNLLEYKKERNTKDAFIIRNGKIKVVDHRKLYSDTKIEFVIRAVLNSLEKDLAHLKNQSIIIDDGVDYGLPISRKQTVGDLPFGTTVSIEGNSISSGIYWEDAWGARDLDLSTVDISGNRTGWGQYSGYGENDVLYSGDLTSAHNGAMEFMTSKTSYSEVYGLFVNIYSGDEVCETEVVVGNKTDSQWIETPIIREKIKLESRGTLLGFVRDGKYVAYTGRMNSNRVSGGSKTEALINRGLSKFWTVQRLFDNIGIKYNQPGVSNYDHDLSYSSFSYDKLESLFLVK